MAVAVAVAVREGGEADRPAVAASLAAHHAAHVARLGEVVHPPAPAAAPLASRPPQGALLVRRSAGRADRSLAGRGGRVADGGRRARGAARPWDPAAGLASPEADRGATAPRDVGHGGIRRGA